MFLIAICFVCSLVYIYFEYCYKYWLWRGVPSIPTTFPFGNIKENLFNRKFIGMLHKEFYDQFKKKGYKHGGIYMINDPAYLAIDPDIIKLILIKDFQHFTSRSISIDDETEPLAANLINLDGPKWKFLRTKLTPTFTSGKMKMMFTNIIVCAEQMKQVLDEMVDGSNGVDMKDILARFTTDVIGSCAFGIECNSLKNPKVKFREYGLKMFRRSIFDFVKRIIMIIPIGRFLHRKGLIKLSSNGEVSTFFSNLTHEIVNYRQTNNIERNDFLQLLIQMKNSGTEKDDKKLSMDQITAQTMLFFAAGFETSSSTMNFAIYELAQNKDIQQRLRNEINANLNENNNQLTYESVMTMPYLDQVVSETLRKYPIASSIMRKCTQTYKIPNSSIEIEKGTPVIIPIYGLHHDPEYFSEPHIFDPERFSDECKKERKSCVYLPFGDGPRNCIGLRFGLMQTKIGIATILRNFEVSLNDKTILPLTMNNRSLILSPKHTIWINLRKIQH